ncbi:EAL domain-containing protein [Stutzerimonas stutzeri]|uniref:EAL domain-containing protein n=1 Tax=Stutzerimonas stutzeri TaxID=316 RepID=UPI001C2F06CC|nr:EAL domain-containing protein [Stutzerimonas stutzeri]
MTSYAFVENATVLLALCWLLSFTARHWGQKRQLPEQLIAGLWFGGACITGMLMPIAVQSGIIFDARTVVLSMAALFGGPLVAGIAGLLAGAYRVWLGGSGVWVGLINVLLPIGLGLGYRYFYRRERIAVGFWQLLAFGLLLHAGVVASLLLLPAPFVEPTLEQIAIPMLLVLPTAVVLLGLLLADMLNREQIERAMHLNEARLRAITQAIPDVLLVIDEDGRYVEVIANDAALLHDIKDRLVGKTLDDVLPAAQAERFHELIRSTLATHNPGLLEYSIQTVDGLKVYEVRAQRLNLAQSFKPAVVCLSRDISDRAHAEQERRIAAIAFESQQGMIITNAENRILRVNQAFSEISGYSAEEAIGEDTRLLASGRHSAEFYVNMWRSIQQTGAWQGEIWNRRKSGEVYPEWLTISTVLDAQGNVSNYVAAFTDITERKQAEERIHHLAFYDPLSGLPNRRLLLDRLRQALAATARSQRYGALMFIDLDNFKNVNDLHGHQAGDQLLCVVAERLGGEVRSIDTVARLGGDEFVVMLEDLDTNAEYAAAQAEQIGEKILSALNEPYRLGSLLLHSSASMGVVLINASDGDAEELMKRADMSMYEAKQAGKNALRFFDPRMQYAVQERLRLEDEIRRGLEAGEFVIHFQPQIERHRGLVGAEALVRWRHPQRGLLSPIHFIAPAERAGLIEVLDFVVLTQACEQLAAWAERPQWRDLTLAVNLSASLLYQADFIRRLLKLLARTGANPRLLKLEITESLLLDDMEEAVIRMKTLKQHGIRFSIDDFGTGYSSMAYLQRLPLDQLKIDQSFVRQLADDAASQTIVRATCALAAGFNLEVIAEGVETEAQRALLIANGCDMFQGYLFSQPVPLEAFEALPLEHLH